MNTRALFVGCFAIVSGLIAFDEIRKCHELPWPPRFIATGIVFMMLDLLSTMAASLATAFAVGFVLAMLVCTAAPTNQATGKPTCNMSLFGTNCNERKGVATIQPGVVGETSATVQTNTSQMGQTI